MKADIKIIENRRDICTKCQYIKDKWLGIIKEQSCGICKCSIPKKTYLKMSKCPKGKW